MNQKLIFAQPIFPVSVSTSGNMPNRLAIAVLLACVCAPVNAFAQGQFSLRPASNATASYESWTPPSSSPGATSGVPSENQPAQSPAANVGFPEAPVTFTPYDRPATFDNSTAPHDTNSSIESRIDSTASMLSGLSDSVGEKTSGWFAAIKQNSSWTEKIGAMFGSSETGKMLGSLALVLGLYFAFVWVMRKINPGGDRGLPPEVVSVMGQVAFGPRRNLQLVRLGSKLLLLMNSPEGTQPIGEITDALEVEYLTSLCPGKTQNNGSVGAIHLAAKRLAESSPQRTDAPQQTPSSTNLTQVIRMLESAAKQGGAVFEA